MSVNSFAFTVRRATLDDVETLVQLRLGLLRELGMLADDSQVAATAEANRRYFAAMIPTQQFIAWIAEADGALVATSGLVPFARPPVPWNLSGLDGYIMNMYTLPAWRGQGIATALLNEIIAYVKSAGGRRLWLQATEAGRPIYEKAGFRPVTERSAQSDTVAMDLRL
jgi:GNAT superfamily N-acetyltransferase